MNYIPVNTPRIWGSEKLYLDECLRTGWVSSEGPYVKEFEQRFSEYIGRKHAISVSSGTAALDISISLADLKEGDEVLVPSFTIISCISELLRIGIKPVFLDSELDMWNVDTDQIEQKINKNTKAIIIPHIYHFPVNMDKILALASSYKLFVIEDAAEMHGQDFRGKKCGSFGDVSIFSFYANKHITTGEGGMILTDDDDLAEQCRSYRNLCFRPGERFIHDRIGWNYRFTNIQAALGLGQLDNIDEIVSEKRRIGMEYYSNLEHLTSVQILPPFNEHSENIFWVFGLLLKPGQKLNSKEIRVRLNAEGIGTRPFFFPLHLQPIVKQLTNYEQPKLKNAEYLYENGFYVPSGLGLSQDDQERVISVLHDILD
jgi:perosamine synthetase